MEGFKAIYPISIEIIMINWTGQVLLPAGNVGVVRFVFRGSEFPAV